MSNATEQMTEMAELSGKSADEVNEAMLSMATAMAKFQNEANASRKENPMAPWKIQKAKARKKKRKSGGPR